MQARNYLKVLIFLSLGDHFLGFVQVFTRALVTVLHGKTNLAVITDLGNFYPNLVALFESRVFRRFKPLAVCPYLTHMH